MNNNTIIYYSEARFVQLFLFKIAQYYMLMGRCDIIISYPDTRWAYISEIVILFLMSL